MTPTVSLDKLTHRDSLGYWLNDAELLGEGVEVGSAFGQFAGRILATWKGSRLFLVDPWDNLPPSEYREEHSTVNYETWLQTCQQLAAQDPRAVLLRKRSADAVGEFKDLSLDFVYIDGNHDYGHVLQDLDNWVPKLKRGGLLGGHDFYNSRDGGGWCEVASAVMRWMKEHNMTIYVTPACTSWWMIKV